ncbi:MAG: LPS export ABC transporter periplasmic protein LptC [Nitrospirae bacterium]|nr:LPS export ABC transporter periplasmic protein LptC [Nitrospirota bacterium]
MVIRRIEWKALPLWIMIAAGLAALGSVLLSELRVRGVSPPLSPTVSDGDVVVAGFHLTTTINGMPDWELTATRARLYEGRHQALLEDVRGAARTQEGSMVEFEGASATFETESQDVWIEGPPEQTIVRLPSGYVIRADQLHWNHQTRELSSDRTISIKGPRISVTGTGLIVKPPLQEFSVLRDVRAEVL